MNLYEFTKKYGVGKGETMMWHTVEIISDFVEKEMSDKAKSHLFRELYGKMSGGHYDEHFAKEDVAKLYYTDNKGDHHAPYWTDDQVKAAYESVKSLLPSEYNMWDFYVVLNMIKSDTILLLMKWFPQELPEDLDRHLVESSVNWLNDPDNPYGSTKIWSYMNPA